MDNQWIKLSVKCKTENLDDVCAAMSMLDNGLMIEDFSDFSFNGMYGELVDEKILNADRSSATVSIFVPAEKSVAEYRAYLVDRFALLGIEVEYELSGVCEDDWAENWKKY
ncbi:MAG: 50S ribosomal protein L11 methyltransferase, partial [Clostridia bacterium]|nr:50S ribosomal protein L11 methyltransferase [Clostridia bacterium]